LNLKLSRYRQYTLDPACGGLGGKFLRIALDIPGQRDDPAIRGDTNMCRCNAWVLFELGQHGKLQMGILRHRGILCETFIGAKHRCIC